MSHLWHQHNVTAPTSTMSHPTAGASRPCSFPSGLWLVAGGWISPWQERTPHFLKSHYLWLIGSVGGQEGQQGFDTQSTMPPKLPLYCFIQMSPNL